ncbi:MAG: FHA domain-containing protein [Vulcanimicrobiota bacterium]
MPEREFALKITREEAMGEHVDDLLKRQKSLRGESAGIDRGGKKVWFYQNWFVFMIAGLLGALLAWGLLEPAFQDRIEWRGTLETLDLQSVAPEGLEGQVQGKCKVRGQVIYFYRDMKLAGSGAPFDASQLSIGQEVAFYIEGDAVATYVDPNPHGSYSTSKSLSELSSASTMAAMVLFPLVAGMVGLFIGAADGLVSRLMGRALVCGGVGLVVGLIGGVFSTILATLVYNLLSGWATDHTGTAVAGLSLFGFMMQVIARALGWALAGLTMGLGQGIALRSSRLATYGLLGGVIGGLLGGLCFDPIDLLLLGGDGQVSAHLSRGVGIGVIGAVVGFTIGIVELLARDSWLQMLKGPLTGKEFLLYKDTMVLGASPKCDIYLFSDDQVLPMHGQMRSVGEETEIESLDSENPVLVNGRPVTRCRLNGGDQITIGKTVFSYRKKNR